MANPSLPNFTNKKLRADWLASLPLAHHDELEKALTHTMTELNHSIIPPHQRYISLETISEPLSQLIQEVKKQIFNSNFPPSEKHQHYIDNFCVLMQQVSDGYLRTIESLAAHGYDKNGTFFTVSIYRAIQLHFTLQYLAYTNYRVPDTVTWANIHKLYQLAHTNRIHLENVIAGPLDLVQAEHIESLYKQTLLLSLASPFQLSNNFTTKLTQTLAYWVQYCNVYDMVEPTSHHGLFVVQLNSSAPPKPIKECNLNAGPGLFFDTTHLLERLKQIAYRPGIQLLPEYVKDLINNNPLSSIKRVYKSWGKFGKRAFPRRQVQTSLELTLGFRDIYNLLCKKQHIQIEDLSGYDNINAHFSSHSVSDTENKDLFIDAFGLNGEYDPANKSIPHMLLGQVDPKYKQQQSSSPEFLVCTATVIDESAGGYCLSIPNETPHSINIGDLVCCQVGSNENAVTTLCVIRWMKEAGRTFLFGIEVIAPFTEAITIREITKRTEESVCMPALLLPQIVSLDLAPSLILPRSVKLQTTSEYLMKTATDEQVITLNSVIDSTGLYNQFSYNAELSVNSA